MDKKLTLLVALIFLSPILRAETIDFNEDYWQCTAYDAQDKHWTIRSTYELTATNKAFDACKKESSLPTTCKALREHCEIFIQGISTRPMWRCTALDQAGTPWQSTVYQNPDAAALAAKAYCRDQSPLPDTCYIHTLTCRNLNQRVL